MTEPEVRRRSGGPPPPRALGWSVPGKGFESKHATLEDLEACRALLCTGSRTFFAASRVLPWRVRQPATALYAFCRLADDAIDASTDDLDATLARLRQRLDDVYAGRPAPEPVERAFADVVAEYSIPRELPFALLEGFAWDAAGRRYETLAQLQDYAARVAGTVGAMMAVLMGVRDPGLLARACDLGVAMQLTNIARDVGEDARIGRLYLPIDWLREAGIDPADFLARPAFSPAIGAVVARLLAAAEPLYARAAEGVAGLPAGCRPGMEAARLLYAEIGAEVARRGYDSVSSRAIVPRGRKSRLLVRALRDSLDPLRRLAGERDAPPLHATSYLVDAVRESPSPRGRAWRSYADGIVWMMELFDRLERREAGTESREGAT